MRRFAVDRTGENVLLAEGELDLLAVPLLRAHLGNAAVTTVDLGAVTFIDSSILAVLVDAHGARQQRGGLVVRNPSASVRRILRVSGLDRWLPVQIG
ncbi:MAG: STAS domain-containing protein [Ilumatobacteraceae bacterium]